MVEKRVYNTLPIHPPPNKLQSQTSYLENLVITNKLIEGIYIQQLAFPYYNKRYFATTPDFPLNDNSHLVQACGCTSDQLDAMTYKHIASKFSRGSNIKSISMFLADAMSNYARQCVKCVQERGFRTLVDRFALLEFCSIHGEKLLDMCPSCGQKISCFAPRPLMLSCPHCNFDFTLVTFPKGSIDDLAKAKRTQDDLAFFCTPHDSEKYAGIILKSMGVELAFERRKSNQEMRSIAKELGVSQTCLSGIENGESLRGSVTFQRYWNYADYFNLSLRYLYEQAYHEVKNDSPRVNWSLAQRYEDFLLSRVKDAVSVLSQSPELISRTRIIQYLKLTPAMNFYKRIRKFLDEEIPRIQEQQLHRRDMLMLCDLKQAVMELNTSNQVITRNLLRSVTGISSGMMDRRLLLSEYLDEVTISKNDARASYIQKLEQQVVNAIRELEAQELHISSEAIARKVNKPLDKIMFYDSTRNLIIEASGEKEHLISEQQTLSEVELAYTYLTQTLEIVYGSDIADHMHISITNLRKFPFIRQYLDYIDTIARERYEQSLFAMCHQAMDQLENEGRLITQKDVAQIVGINKGTLRFYPLISGLFQQIRQMQLEDANQYVNGLYKQTVDAVSMLRRSGKDVNTEAIARIVDISSSTLCNHTRIHAYLKSVAEREAHKKAKYVDQLTRSMIDAIEKLRAAGTLTQKQVADELHVSLGHLRKYEQTRQLLCEIAPESRTRNYSRRQL
jgi:transcriptional regulator with XRE-family HTH domain